jgi:trimeric autotransporter adhesin
MSFNISALQAGFSLFGQQAAGYASTSLVDSLQRQAASAASRSTVDIGSIESRAVRLARAQFTAPVSTPPWKAGPGGSDSSRLAAVRAMKSLIDKPTPNSKLGTDVDASFTIWKALDRLKLLAAAATRTTMLAGERGAIATQFSSGMAALQSYMATVDSSQLNLSFGQPARRVDTLAIERSALGGAVKGRGVATDRSAAISNLDADAVLRISVTRGGTTRQFDLAIADLAQPPSLDNLAAGLNARLEGLEGVMGRFAVEKTDGKWHLALDAPATEGFAIDEIGAADALIVAASDGLPGGAGPTRIVRYDAPDAAMDRRLLGLVAATDRQAMLATARPDVVVPAAMTISASVTDAQGFTTLLGTTAGDVGNQRAEGNGNRDLVLTRLDSRGQVVWQRMLGAVGDTEGAALALTADGDVVVAATVAGGKEGGLAGGDALGASDMVVARFDRSGDQRFATLVPRAGDQRAAAVVVAADGSILVGGDGNGGADTVLTRFDSDGQLAEVQTVVGGGGIRALAMDADGGLLALVQNGAAASLQRRDATNLALAPAATVALGTLQARQLVVSAAGQIAVGGTDVAGVAGGRDGVVSLVSADFGTLNRINIGSSGNDQLDSLAFADDGSALYAGGRTSGTLGAARTGTTDGFVARLDMTAGGAIAAVTQFGQVGRDTGPVQISFAVGGAAKAPEAIGFQRGTINADGHSPRLVDATRLRVGDSFRIKVGSGPLRAVTVAANDTLATFAAKVRAAAGSRAAVTTPTVQTANGQPGQALRIQSMAGYPIQLLPGPSGQDALAALGLAPGRIFTPPNRPANAPSVRPGGQFGLGLNDALNLRSADAAKVALGKLESALSTTQTGYRSLYWDSTKAQMADGGKSFALTRAQAVQLDQYSRALDRLTSLATYGPGVGL